MSEASDSCNAAVVACFYENILPISQTALLLIITKCDFLLPSFFSLIDFTSKPVEDVFDRMFQMCFVSHSTLIKTFYKSKDYFLFVKSKNLPTDSITISFPLLQHIPSSSFCIFNRPCWCCWNDSISFLQNHQIKM